MASVARSSALSQPLIVTDSKRGPHILNRKYSAWRVLINTNVSRKSISREHFLRIVRQLNESWEFCFGATPPDIKTFQPFTPEWFPMLAAPDNPFVHWKKHSDPKYPPPKASSRKKGEVGKKFGKIHLHGEFRIIHYGNVRLDYNALKGRMKELLTAEGDNGDLGIVNPYISFQYLSDRDGDEEYLNTKGEEELARDQTENVLGPLTTLEEETNAILASNESSNSRRRIIQDSDNDDDIVHPPTPPPQDDSSDEEEEEYTGPHARRSTRSGREYGGVVMPRSEFRSRRRRGKK
jgi:hypothetical protein